MFFAQISCSDVINLAAEVDIEAPGFDIDVANYEFYYLQRSGNRRKFVA